MTDAEFLAWIHDRLVMVHGEKEGADYMHRLRSIIVKLNVSKPWQSSDCADKPRVVAL